MAESAPSHPQESQRLEALHTLGLTTPPAQDPRLNILTKEATERLHAPISTVSIIDKDKEIYRSCQGIDAQEGPRSAAFCSWALLSKNMFVVEDTLKDERFKDNPYVTGEPHVRFYAGIALTDRRSGLPIGVFCIKDTKPRTLSVEEIAILMELSERAEKIVNTPPSDTTKNPDFV